MTLKSNTKPILGLTAALAVLLAASAWALRVGPFGSSTDRGEIIATVDGAPIYLSEAQSRVEGLASTHGGGAGPLSTSDWPQTILQTLVDDRLVREEAARRGIEVTDKDVADQVLRIQKEMFPDLAAYQAWLESQGMDQGELNRRIELQTLTVRVFNAVTADVDVSAEALHAYYEANPDQFVGADGGPMPFSEARDSVEQTLKNQAYTAWLEDQRRTVDVVVVDDQWWRKIDEQQI
jgi:hypothetical protein